MNQLKILTYPDSRLAIASEQVKEIDQSVQDIIDKMASIMYGSQGIGLAGVQVGIYKKIIIYDILQKNGQKQLQALINPEIVSSNGMAVSENEGCLSLPDFRSNVKRAASVFVTGLDRNGKSLEIEADGLLSIVLQHEIDHLTGILLIDRVSLLKKRFYKKKIAKQVKHNEL